jgi:hypothetical protein
VTSAPRSLDERLRVAINGKRLIELRYHGRRSVAEPHDYGVQKGVDTLLVYQLRGEADSAGKSTNGWRLLEVSKIEESVVLDDTFGGSRGQQHRNHYNWDILYTRVR